MRGIVALIATLLLVFAVAYHLGGGDRTSPPGTYRVPPVTTTPAEDHPDWDCRLHGDRVCGTATPNG